MYSVRWNDKISPLLFCCREVTDGLRTNAGIDAKRAELFEGESVPRAIAKLSIPTILSQIITMIYNLADTFFVGHTGDPCQVAALTLVFPLYMLLTGVGNLFGIGANSKISRCLGCRDIDGAHQTAAFTFLGGLACTALMLLLIGSSLSTILRAMGASNDTLGPAKAYLVWVLLVGGIPTEASLLLAHMLRGEGRTAEAGTGMMLGGVLNMILDPIFIFGLEMGVGGAGLATMLSNVACLLWYCFVLWRHREGSVIRIGPKHFSFFHAKEILLVGLPAAMVIALGSSANIVLTRLLSGYGDLPVAAFGVTQKFGTITMNLSIGLTQGIMPLIGYHYAAGNSRKVREICRVSCRILFCFVACLFLLYQAMPLTLVRLFVSDDATAVLGSGFLRRYSLCIPGMTFIFLFNSIFQAMGLWKRSLLITVLRQAGLFIPITILLDHWVGLYGIVWAQPIADTLSFAFTFILMLYTLKNQSSILD